MSTTTLHRRLVLAVLGVVALLTLPIALPLSAAQAFCGSLCAPGAAPILAESAGISGGLISGASTAATSAAGVSATAGAGAGNIGVTAASGVTVIGGPSAASTAATGAASIVASIGGFFGLKALFGGPDAEGTDWKAGSAGGGSTAGWSGSRAPHTWGLSNVPQYYPEVDGLVTVTGDADGVTVQVDFPGGDPDRYDRPQDVAVQAFGLVERSDGTTTELSIGSLNFYYGHSTVRIFQAGDAIAAGILRAITRVTVDSAPTRGGDVATSGTWSPTVADTMVQVIVTGTCSDGTVVTKSSMAVRAGGSGELPIPDAVCRPGSVLTGSRGVLVTTGPGGSTTDVLWDTPAPDWVPKIAAENPACLEAGASCVLEPRKNMPDGSVQSCFSSPGLCTDWIPKQKAGDTSVQCWFGPYRVAVERCYAYPNPGVDPTVPTATPDGTPRTPTTTPTDPSDSPTPGTPGNPAPGDAEANQCFPTGWGMLNPVQWVYQPVKCALSWAFVPSPGTVAQIDGLGPSLATRTPFPQIQSALAWFTPPQESARCWDLRVGFPKASGLPQNVAVLNSCDTSNPIVAWMLDHRSVLSAVIWFGTLAPFAWWFWRQYAPGASGVA